MSKKKKIILAVVIIVAIAAVSVGFFLKGKLGKSSGGGDAAYADRTVIWVLWNLRIPGT